MSEEEAPLYKSQVQDQPARKEGGIKMGFLLTFIFTIGIGAFQFGFSIASFNALQDDFAFLFEWDEDDKKNYSSIITSVCQLGSAVGAIGVGPFQKYGKKKCILFANLLIFFGAGITMVKNIPVIALGRFCYGVATGSFSVLVPGIINEVAPVELKGPLGSMTQILITIGIMVAFFLGLPIPEDISASNADEFAVANYWRVVFALPIVFGLIQCSLLLTVFNYETPKFLKQHNKNAQLNQLMGKIYEVDRVSERIDLIAVDQGKVSEVTYSETFCHPKYRYATIIGCTLSVLQQLSGINAVMFYSSEIFKKVKWSPRVGTAVVGFTNMISTFGALFLLGKFGRKTLLWTLSFVMSLDLIALGISYFYIDDSEIAKTLCIIFIILFVIIFEFSLGPIPWLYLAEILNDKGLSIAVLLNWLMTLLMAIITPFAISGEFFIVLGGFCTVCGFFSLFLLKETKGLTEAEVAKLYNREKKDYEAVEAVDKTQ